MDINSCVFVFTNIAPANRNEISNISLSSCAIEERTVTIFPLSMLKSSLIVLAYHVLPLDSSNLKLQSSCVILF